MQGSVQDVTLVSGGTGGGSCMKLKSKESVVIEINQIGFSAVRFG